MIEALNKVFMKAKDWDKFYLEKILRNSQICLGGHPRIWIQLLKTPTCRLSYVCFQFWLTLFHHQKSKIKLLGNHKVQ